MNPKKKKSTHGRPVKIRVKKPTLEYQLLEVLQGHAGERGYTEGAVDTLCRIVHERDMAFKILAIDRLKESLPVCNTYAFR